MKSLSIAEVMALKPDPNGEGPPERYPYLSAKRPYYSKAKIRWPRAIWISGEGRWARVAHCNGLTVELHKTKEEAEEAKCMIDSSACGGFCYGDHSVVDMNTRSRREEERLRKWQAKNERRKKREKAG